MNCIDVLIWKIDETPMNGSQWPNGLKFVLTDYSVFHGLGLTPALVVLSVRNVACLC